MFAQLLGARGIPVHSVTSRVKSRDSYAQKIGDRPSKYKTLDDVTDIVGVRIITYFTDQVEQVAQLVSDEFAVDTHNSVDKRAVMDPDRFGYLSLHFIVALSENRRSLGEYRQFRDLKAEVQVRSILQHAWAEIEHDLGYKSAQQIPRDVRRQFARLAGLLELADSEFVAIRKALSLYGEHVSKELASSSSSTLALDGISIKDFAHQEPIVEELDGAIGTLFNAEVVRNPKSDHGLVQDVEKFHYLGIDTVAQLHDALEVHREDILALASAFLAEEAARDAAGVIGPKHSGPIHEGISLFYLAQILAARGGSVADALAFLERFRIGDPFQTTEEIATELVAFMSKRHGAPT